MAVMRRGLIGLVVALAALVARTGTSAQEFPILRVEVSAPGADGQLIPVARHALLVSEVPTSAPPRRIVTLADGTAQIRLRPGKYIVESDRPVVVGDRAYEWTETVDVVAGRGATLRLTTANASASAATSDLVREAAAESSAPVEQSASILTTWQASAFELWTPHAHAAGFLVDERGLVATSLRAIGDARSIEVQVSPTLKVMGTVIVPAQGSKTTTTDVAIVRVHPSAVEGVRAVPLVCDATAAAAATADADQYVVTVPLFGQKDIDSSLVVAAGAAGGPVFSGEGRVVGLSSPSEAADPVDLRGRIDVRVVGTARICEAVAPARAALAASAPPDGARRPVEPLRQPKAMASAVAARGTFSLGAYQLSTSDFDLTFITPEVLTSVQGKGEWTGGRAEGLNGSRVATDFEHWTEYVAEAPPLLYVRVTPRLVEGFWMKVARGAASTQGAAIPPIKRLGPGFSHMRLMCGATEVTPMHPFRIRTRVSETEAIDEGFYVFDPAAISPACGAVSIVLSSLKDPKKSETRTIDPAIVRRVSEDFASSRAVSVPR